MLLLLWLLLLLCCCAAPCAVLALDLATIPAIALAVFVATALSHNVFDVLVVVLPNAATLYGDE